MFRDFEQVVPVSWSRFPVLSEGLGQVLLPLFAAVSMWCSVRILPPPSCFAASFPSSAAVDLVSSLGASTVTTEARAWEHGLTPSLHKSDQLVIN